MARALLATALATLAAVAAVAAAAAACAPGCACTEGGTRLECRGLGLRRLPPLHEHLISLDVSNNNISTLPRDALQPAIGLRDLNLSSNRLESVSSGALAGAGAGAGAGAALARLWLDRCALRRLPARALDHLPRLHYLSAEDNWISSVSAEDVAGVRALRTLRLARNALRRVPSDALALLTHLQTLNLAGNAISELTHASLPPLPALHTLILKRNRIAYVDERAFVNTPAIRFLRLEENLLTEIPAAVQLLPLLEDLSVASNRVEGAGGAGGALRGARRLARLDLRANPLAQLQPHALADLPHLTALLLSEARGLRALPPLNASARLRTLRADRARLTLLPPHLCAHAPQLRTLDVKSNQLEHMPDLHECSELRVLELSSNAIRSVEGRPLRGLRRLHDLLLARNRLERLPADVFRDTPDLQLLDLEDNKIEHIDIEAFVPISKLEDLNVGNNVFPWLPASGLQRLLHLKAHNNPNLRHFHPPELFPRIQTLVLSYAYHCCEFMSLSEGGAGGEGSAGDDEECEGEGLTDVVLVPPQRIDPAAWLNQSDLWPQYLNVSGESGAGLRAVLGESHDGREWGPWAEWATDELRATTPRRVRCLPLPGPFLPCVDLFDWWTLRCGVWAVFLLALLGNGTVVFVLVFSRSRMDVPRFLVTNLAAADFFMGVYLGILAVVDAGTLGQFRAHAIAWQTSGACRLAGFLGVLSSELSVYTLAVITLERNYAITHAMHLNKRLSLRHAGIVMAAGWGLALLAAALPLAGVSDYRKFAVCLPFETGSPSALAYVVSLLAVNGIAFLVLLGCYLKMYCAIRGSQAWNSNDSRIAKRMALLVFTDFLCWSPIAFFALTAAFGAQLVSLEEAKVFTVFVLPLNSCCNPFLYAILTKQFKKDCALVCKAIEESRVTRGIGRCRHSSNFSNRQTPANTNSLAERSSRGGHGAACACRRLLAEPRAPAAAAVAAPPRLLRWLRACGRRAAPSPAPAARPAPGGAGRARTRTGAAAPARAGSVSSSVEFSSSRSDSWRACAARPPPPRRAASWLVARKTSQDSNLSSSRNDSSGSNATASTGTWRTSRSAGAAPGPGAGALAGGAAGGAAGGGAGGGAPRPRLTRQPAVLADEPPLSPPALGPPPRQLHTIPSAAETELQTDESEPPPA